jgi:hypothetical protein
MKKLQESIDEYRKQKQLEENKHIEWNNQQEQVINERIEKRNEFLSKDNETDAEKEEIGKTILNMVANLTCDELFMKGLNIANSTSRVTKIFETDVKDEGEVMDDIRRSLGGFKRQVTHVFGLIKQKNLIYYQYWSATGWVESMARRESDAFLLRIPADFKRLPFDAVYSFHKALQEDKVTDQLAERIKKITSRRDF